MMIFEITVEIKDDKRKNFGLIAIDGFNLKNGKINASQTISP